MRPHSGKCAPCHQCISRWKRPRQLLVIRPVSCGGVEPAQWIAVRYCDSTTRRSSSGARSSRLPDRSSAPPVLQNRSQCRADDASTSSYAGSSAGGSGPKATTSSTTAAREVIRNSCGPPTFTSAPGERVTVTPYRVSSSTRSTANPPGACRSLDVWASGRDQSAALPHACDP